MNCYNSNFNLFFKKQFQNKKKTKNSKNIFLMHFGYSRIYFAIFVYFYLVDIFSEKKKTEFKNMFLMHLHPSYNS